MMLGALAATLMAGCGSRGGDVKAGELGNGGFTFSCDDGAACTPYSHEATTFPSAVSLSSTFDVKFRPRTTSSDGPQPQGGITLSAIGETFFTRGPEGFVAQREGHGTIAAFDATGKLVDYTVIKIVKPDALTIYDADVDSVDDADPRSVDLIALKQGESRSFRVLLRNDAGEPLAGKIGVKWSAGSDVASMQPQSSGRYSVYGNAAGSTIVAIDGAALHREIKVVVTP
ncbi:hypothetical protein AKJ09_04632 [Labilithrix luteola]|uniref:Uncharacterized protein n=2 Tax=Labilithrix luteola TaxID=1391654 RepID=A0A0K1PWR3_9BACT|nr:hypothetical protein AKJ09_04632 [Labilithrix luteola]